MGHASHALHLVAVFTSATHAFRRLQRMNPCGPVSTEQCSTALHGEQIGGIDPAGGDRRREQERRWDGLGRVDEREAEIGRVGCRFPGSTSTLRLRQAVAFIVRSPCTLSSGSLGDSGVGSDVPQCVVKLFPFTIVEGGRQSLVDAALMTVTP